jgi:TPR repeat protein
MKKHLLEAAERGDAEAQFNLGIIYENGLNDSRYVAEGNRPEAVRWLLAAAEQGLPRAQIKLAEIYAGEPDMPESSARACGWILLATASLRGAHLQSAQSAHQRACIGLTPAEIEQASPLRKAGGRVGRPVPQCWVREKVPRKTHMINSSSFRQ